MTAATTTKPATTTTTTRRAPAKTAPAAKPAASAKTAPASKPTDQAAPMTVPTVKRFIPCEGGKQDWLVNADRKTFDCPSCGQTSKDLKVNLKVSSGKPVPPKVPSHKVEKDVPVTQTSSGSAASSKKAEAKRALARLVVQAIADQLSGIENLLDVEGAESARSDDAQLVKDELGVGEDMQRIAVQWIHHLPTGQVDGKRWWPAGLATPDRSDWR